MQHCHAFGLPQPFPRLFFGSRPGLRSAMASSGRALATLGVVGMAAGGPPPRLRGGPDRGGNSGGSDKYSWQEFGHPSRRLTDTLLVLNVALYGAQLLTQEGLTLWGVKVNQLIVAGQWWRLVTPAFLHGSLIHLAVNCASLNNLAPVIEATAGKGRFAAIYLAAAVAGNVASFYGSTSPSLGASGAIFGVGGAMATYFYRNRRVLGDKRSAAVLRQLWQTLLINVAYGFLNPRIDNWGHMGGMLGGALVSYLLGPRYQAYEYKNGMYLLDEPPVKLLTNAPRKISGR